MKWLVGFFLALVVLLLGGGVYALAQMAVANPAPEIGYTDLLVIILTVLSIMITLLGIGLAVAGVIGWATFESKLKDNSLSYFARALEKKDGNLRREMEALITEITYKGIEEVKTDVLKGHEQNRAGDGKEDEYVD